MHVDGNCRYLQGSEILLHDLILGKTLRVVPVHVSITVCVSVSVEVFDEAQAERASSVLVAGKLRNGGVGVVRGLELHDTSATRTTIGLVLNLSFFNFPNGLEKFHKIFIAGGPRQLGKEKKLA